MTVQNKSCLIFIIRNILGMDVWATKIYMQIVKIELRTKAHAAGYCGTHQAVYNLSY